MTEFKKASNTAEITKAVRSVFEDSIMEGLFQPTPFYVPGLHSHEFNPQDSGPERNACPTCNRDYEVCEECGLEMTTYLHDCEGDDY